MIGYQMVGTNNFEASAAFYDALLAELGAGRFMEEEGQFIAWASAPDKPAFCICKPHDGKKASVGNGGMTAFSCDDTATVDKMYAKAIALGGTCEGSAGPRGDGPFYAGYFRDPDGNKCNFFSMSPPK